jgi:uncharacterized membrane protein YkvA (DUF1232 family)
MSTIQKIQRLLALLRDPRVGKWPRIAVLAALVYLVSPIDLIPDFAVPIVGWLDDATILWMAIRWLVKAGDDADHAGQLDIPTVKRID